MLFAAKIGMRQLAKFAAMTAGALLLAAPTLFAQSDSRDADHLRVQYEDDQVRVLWLTLPARQTTPFLSLVDRVTVAANDGTIKIIRRESAASSATTVDIKAGETTHYDAGSISYVNEGVSEWHCVIMEYKQQGGKAPENNIPGKLPNAATDRERTQVHAEIPAATPPSNPTTNPNTMETGVPPSPKTAQQPPVAQPQPRAEQVNPQSETVEPTSLNVDGAKMAFLNGTELAYIERGQGPPVVLVHDTLGDYRSWAPQLAALSKSYRVIAYSQRYHYPNHSTGKERDYSYDINAKDLADFIRGLNAGPVRLVGFGYGASIAGMVAAEHPELVKALVITEPAYEELLDATMAQRSRYAREDLYGMIRKPLTKDKPEKGVQVYVDWLGYQTWDGLSTEEQFRRKQNGNALHAQTFDAAPPDFTCATAKKISAPTLILSGQKRSANSAEIAGVLSACVPNAERATVPDSGAAIYVDNPAGADKSLVEFLAKH